MSCCSCKTKDSPEKESTNDKDNNIPIYPSNIYNKFICVFCGGKSCKHENFRNHPNPAIYGLHSDQIEENIFASQRPSNVLIEEHNLVNKFKEKNIGMIVNLQIPGEHPNCGPNGKLDEYSGYSYSPSLFSTRGIEVLLAGWRDMNSPDTFAFILDVVKKMDFIISVKKQKVLVHCHAGYGRTGICIACYKMFKYHINAETAIKQIRSKRSMCVQKQEQFEYCINFYEFLKNLLTIFGKKKDIHYYLRNQSDYFLGSQNTENCYLNYIPILIIKTLNSILALKETTNIDTNNIISDMIGDYKIIQSDELKEKLKPLIENIDLSKWVILSSYNDCCLISELMFKWLKDNVNYCINVDNITKIFREKKDGILFNELNEDNKKLEIIKENLYLYEYKILAFIAQFMSKINSDNIDEIILKFSYFLLGFGKCYAKNYKNRTEEQADDEDKNAIDCLVNIFKFLLEHPDVNEIKEEINLPENIKNIFSIQIKSIINQDEIIGQMSKIKDLNEENSKINTARGIVKHKGSTIKNFILEEDC